MRMEREANGERKEDSNWPFNTRNIGKKRTAQPCLDYRVIQRQYLRILSQGSRDRIARSDKDLN